MIEAIVYTSQCGHTYRYAKAFAESLNLPLLSLKRAKKKLKKGTPIFYFGWVREDKIVGYSKTIRYSVEGIAAVGIYPMTMELVQRLKDVNLITSNLFYLRGGIDKKRLGILNRFTLKARENELSFKLLDHGLTKEDASVLEAILHNLDYTDISSLTTIISAYVKEESSYVS